VTNSDQGGWGEGKPSENLRQYRCRATDLSWIGQGTAKVAAGGVYPFWESVVKKKFKKLM